jgi:hypothetical protein
MQRVEAVQAPTAFARGVEMEPLQPMQRAEALQAPTAFARGVEMEPLQPMQRVEASEPLRPTMMNAASDSTMTSGVSMTSGGASFEAAQPMQAREMYISPETPSEPLQASAGYEPLARTQMSHAYDAMEPSHPREMAVRATEEPTYYEAVNPLMATEESVAYEAVGGAAAEPLRPTVAHERPVRPTE